MRDGGLSPRAIVARIIAIIIFAILALRLGYIQLVDDRYEKLADDNYLRNVVVYPPRGEIFDRNGELLAQNRLCYDVTIVRKDMPRSGFDTTRVSELVGMSREALIKKIKQSPYRRESRLTRYPISVEQKLLLDERNARDVDRLEPLLDLGLRALADVDRQLRSENPLLFLSVESVKIVRHPFCVHDRKFAAHEPPKARDSLLSVENLVAILTNLHEVYEPERISL